MCDDGGDGGRAVTVGEVEALLQVSTDQSIHQRSLWSIQLAAAAEAASLSEDSDERGGTKRSYICTEGFMFMKMLRSYINHT